MFVRESEGEKGENSTLTFKFRLGTQTPPSIHYYNQVSNTLNLLPHAHNGKQTFSALTFIPTPTLPTCWNVLRGVPRTTDAKRSHTIADGRDVGLRPELGEVVVLVHIMRSIVWISVV